MKYPITKITPPSAEPLTLDELKKFFREDRSVEEPLIEQFGKAARKNIERVTGYQLVDATYEMRLEDFETIKIPKKPFRSLTKIEYVDEDGTTQELGSDKYTVHEYDSPVEIEFKSDLPKLDYREDTKYPIIITFVAGYGTASDVPEDWKSAIGLTAMIYWMRDVPEDVGEEFNPLQLGVVKSLLTDYRIGRFK